jgi:hypothetical protein
MSSIDDLFGDLGGVTDVVVDKVKEYGPTVLSMAASVAAWHTLEANFLAAARNKLVNAAGSETGNNVSIVVGDVFEAVAGIGIAALMFKHRPLGGYNDKIAAGVAIGLVFDATWDLLKRFMPASIAPYFAGLGDSRIYLADADPYHLLAAAPMLVEQVSGAPVSIESVGGAPISISGFGGAPITAEDMSGVGSTLTAMM